MKHFILFVFMLPLLWSCSKKSYDVCIYGGTASGVIAAYSAASLGMDVALVEPGGHMGGMTTGGLGFTDIGNKQVVTGLARHFYREVGRHYGRLEQWIFEPHVASEILASYLSHPGITLMTCRCLEKVENEDGRILRVVLSDAEGDAEPLTLSADYFIDCSYEGDLMASAGVSYTVGREGNDVYGETYNGVQMLKGHQFPDGVDPFVEPGNPDSGLLWGISPAEKAADGTGDSLVQAYNYRICLTDSLENMIPVGMPDNYDPDKYHLLLRLFDAQPSKRRLNDYFIWSSMPGRKTDVNNRGGFSTDMIGMSHAYPEASYGEREKIVKAHKDYTQGLLYFIGHDPRVPEELRSEMLRWGYPKDEYTATGNWTPQLYVRESRRMKGEYVATQADCQGRKVAEDGIAMAAYNMDSHNCQRVVVRKEGHFMVKNEGNVEVNGGAPYPISYRCLVPHRKECRNLLVPVCLSASHIAYGSIRMEPVFMVLGQVSAIATFLASGNGHGDVQDVDFAEINRIMSADPYLDGTPADLLIDDENGEVTLSGDWKRHRMLGGYGPTFLESASGEGTAEFRFSVPETAEYDLYSYQHSSHRLAPESSFEVFSSGTLHHVTLDAGDMHVLGQTSGEWCLLGTYSFEKDIESYVRVTGNGGPVHADALLLIKR